LNPVGGAGASSSVPSDVRDYTQFQVDVPAGTQAFAWDVRSGQPHQQYLLLGRLGFPVTVTGDTGTPVIDFYEISPPNGDLQLVLTSRSIPSVVSGRYFLDVVNLDPARLDYGIGVAATTTAIDSPSTVTLTANQPIADVAPHAFAAEPGAMSPVQYEFVASPNDGRLTITLTPHSSTANLALFVKAGARVGRTAMGFPDAEFTSGGSAPGSRTIVIDVSTNPSLQSGPYFIAIANFTTTDQPFTLQVSTPTQLVLGSRGGGGGGCHAESARPSSFVPTMLGAGLVLLVRRRRSRGARPIRIG